MRLKKFAAIVFLLILLSLSSSYASDSVYISEPSFSPLSAGTVRREILTGALNELNYIRSLIGVPSVTLNDDYTNRAQHGAVLLDVINMLSHTPRRPLGMSETFYKLAYDATSHGNLAMGQLSVNGKVSGNMSPLQSVRQCMDDSDDDNLSRLGHRRWLMNPRMKSTGFGVSTRRGYAVIYVIEEFGKSGALSPEEYQKYLNWKKWPISREYITWPASSTPIEYFTSQTAWSFTPDSDVFNEFNARSVRVKLTRMRDGKVWNFGNSNDGYFNVTDNSVAYDQCIIFRPRNIEYNAGDVFNVEISGLTRKNGIKGNIAYSVMFTPGSQTIYDPVPTTGNPNVW